MIDCSIVSVYSKKDVLEKYLKSSLDRQIDINFEKKIIDNSDGLFSCAKDAISSVIDTLSGKYIVICHQDIEFIDKKSLKNIIDVVDKIKEFGIVGVAGVNGKKIISNIYHGTNKELVTSNTIKKELLCETLDECLFIIKNEKKYIDEFKNLVCSTWHLYAVEYSLKMRLLNENVYVIPSNLYHLSSGNSFDESYYRQLKILANKYGRNIKKINTTMGFWNTNVIILNIQIIISKLRRLKKRMVILWKK